MSLALEYIVRGLITGAMYGLLALPINLLLVTVGTMDFALGAYALIAAAVAVTIGGVWGIAAGIAAALCAGAVMAIIFISFKKVGLEDTIVVALASFGLSVAVTSIVLIQWGPVSFVASGISHVWVMGGIGINPQGLLNVVIGLSILGLLYAVIYGTDLGRMMRAAALNPSGAELSGIPVTLIQSMVFMVGGLISGIAGVLLVHSSGVDFTASLGLSLSAFAAAIVLGVDNPARGFAGGLVIGLAEALAAGYTTGAVTAMVPFIVVLIALGGGMVGAQRFGSDRP